MPVIELSHLTDAQKRAYVLADNRLAEQAGWDRALLSLELADLDELGVDLGQLGFDGSELDALLDLGVGDPREEASPSVPEVPVSRAGELWVLGNHRLICGDATVPATVARLLDGGRGTQLPWHHDPAQPAMAGVERGKLSREVEDVT